MRKFFKDTPKGVSPLTKGPPYRGALLAGGRAPAVRQEKAR